MRNFASPRELTLAPRKKSSLGSLALLLCATGSILTLGHDARAVAGAPALPNLNFVNTGSWRALLRSPPTARSWSTSATCSTSRGSPRLRRRSLPAPSSGPRRV